jgi:hypothetical protein
MLTLRTSDNVRTSRHVKGFRSCGHQAGAAAKDLDRGRVLHEETRRLRGQARRAWLNRQWAGRFERAAERLRVLPPSALSGRK